jgi:predicted regulator of Ras-like GTPase activity (Roadblock/LC7/MglB family)
MFRDSLQRIVDHVDGGIAGLLMGFDGIPVESYSRGDQPIDINTVGMEFSYILAQARKAAEILEVGPIREVTIKAEKLTLVMRVLSPDYFIALALGPDGNYGKGRYLLRMAAPRVIEDL